MSKVEAKLWENIYPVYSVGEISDGFAKSTLSQVTDFIDSEVQAIEKKRGGEKHLGPTRFLRTTTTGYRSSKDTRLANRYARFVHLGQADSVTHFMEVELKPDEEGHQTKFLYKWNRNDPGMRLRQISVVSNSRFEGPLAMGTGGFEPLDILRIASVLRELGIKGKNGEA